MFRSPRYPTDPAAVEAFVAGQHHGTLIGVTAEGFPSISILPFVKDGDTIELHAVRADPTFKALQQNPRCSFLVSDFLAFSPHYWRDPRDAGLGTLHFRAVQYSCLATTSTSPADVAAALARMVARYEPEAEGHEPLADGEFYGPRLRRLGAVRLQIVATEAKFKVGPAAPDEERLHVAAELRARGLPGDARAAAVIEAAVQGETA
jgi:transcriptional regulator